MVKVKYYAVMGHPVNHSLSPYIHQCFASQLGIILNYRILDVPADHFEKNVSAFFVSGNGLNITAPFKHLAWEMADQLTERAVCAESVNTLWKDDNDLLCADNTDGAGLVTDLTKNMGFNIKGSRILIVGAGGAVRGILRPLLNAEPERIVLINRTQKKAALLVEKFQPLGPVFAFTEKQADHPFDLVINGTSAGFTNQLPPVPEQVISKKTIVYDMTYGKASKRFLQWSSNKGAEQVADGTGMLAEQAAEAFFIWHGLRPQTSAVIQSVRKRL